MNNLKIRNILSALFTVLLITVLITGCGKKEANDTSESVKKTETESKNSETSGMDKMGSNMDSNMNSNMKQDHIMINLPTMQCSTCKKNIETAVKKLDGIESIDVVTKEKTAHINFDKSKTDLAKIESTITAAGYDANDKKADPEAYKNLDDCCKLPQDQKKNQ